MYRQVSKRLGGGSLEISGEAANWIPASHMTASGSVRTDKSLAIILAGGGGHCAYIGVELTPQNEDGCAAGGGRFTAWHQADVIKLIK